MIHLNQVYKESATFEQYPNVKQIYDELTEFNKSNKFYVENNDGSIRVKGRRYDNAVLFNHDGVDFNDKIVCELGARDGLFSAWLTKFVKQVYVSDYFEEWGKGTTYDLGQIDYWKNLWTSCAYHPEKMIIEHQDLTKLTYPDNFFDITVCTSVVEHTFNQNQWMGDIVSIREMARITKPGGYILMSTDMTKQTKWHSGTLYYSEMDLFDRLINPSKCQLNGNYDFNLTNVNNSDMHHVDTVGDCTSVVFSLKKPIT